MEISKILYEDGKGFTIAIAPEDVDKVSTTRGY